MSLCDEAYAVQLGEESAGKRMTHSFEHALRHLHSLKAACSEGMDLQRYCL